MTTLAALALVGSACSQDAPSEPASTSEPTSTVTTAPVTALAATETLDVQGHRGARGLKPENTLPAFETALDLGVTTLELDLHFSSDGTVVVWHDPAIDSDKCGLAPEALDDVPDPDDVLVPSRHRRIRALTDAQLAGYQCDRNPDPARFPDQQAGPTALAGADYRPVTLSDLFDFVDRYSRSDQKTQQQRDNAARGAFNIETKRNPDEPGTIGDGFDGITPGPFELEILRVVDEAGVGNRVVIQSFDHRSLWAIRTVDVDIALAALSSRDPVDFEDLAARGATIWSPNYESLSEDRLTDARTAGLSVIPWTVNNPQDMARLIDLDIDGLITDRPDLLLGLVAGG